MLGDSDLRQIAEKFSALQATIDPSLLSEERQRKRVAKAWAAIGPVPSAPLAPPRTREEVESDLDRFAEENPITFLVVTGFVSVIKMRVFYPRQ